MNDDKKLNVGLFIDAFFPMVDGVIMVVDNYAKRLSQFCNVTVFTLKPRGYKKCTRTYPYKVVGCKKMVVPFLDYDLPLPKSDRKFMSELEAADLDIVHIHSPFTIGNVGIRYAKRHKVPVIANLHSQFKMDFFRATKSKALTGLLLKRVVKTFNKCDEYYATNQAFAEVFRDYGVGHMPLVQQNGTDLVPIEDKETALNEINKQFSLDADIPVFLFVGRINKLKNIYFLFEALKLLRCDYKMIFVGDGKDLPEFRQKAGKSNIADKIIFTGKITDRDVLASLYLRSKLLLFPSMYDTNSLVQIEAASQGTPTVFLKGSVTSGTVTDNVNGFLSEPTPIEYAAKIEEILSDDELYNKVSLGAKRDLYVSWDDCVKEVHNKYLQHINNRE